MEIASVKGDTALLLYHPSEAAVEVGGTLTVLELPDQTEGLVVQVISNETLAYAGMESEIVQAILEGQLAQGNSLVNRERGLEAIKGVKVATAKIRKRIREGEWLAWDGWVPSRHAAVTPVSAGELLRRILPEPHVPLRPFARVGDTPVIFDGTGLDMITAVCGSKGGGKSHQSKHVALALTERGVPTFIFDVNREYHGLPRAQVLAWRENFRFHLAEVGHGVLRTVLKTIRPLQEKTNGESTFDNGLAAAFRTRREECARLGQPFGIDIPFLRDRFLWSQNQFVLDAIRDRLGTLDSLGLFTDASTEAALPTFRDIWERACAGEPVVFDLVGLTDQQQTALVRAVNKAVAHRCQEEAHGQGRFAYCLYDEAHLYCSESTILSLITRSRHLGMSSIFVTNTPSKLPEAVFRNLDNLIVLPMADDKDDIRNLCRNSFTDAETLTALATRLKPRHALIVGNLTDRYPLVVSVDDLPEGVPRSGVTKSTWTRFLETAEPVTAATVA